MLFFCAFVISSSRLSQSLVSLVAIYFPISISVASLLLLFCLHLWLLSFSTHVVFLHRQHDCHFLHSVCFCICIFSLLSFFSCSFSQCHHWNSFVPSRCPPTFLSSPSLLLNPFLLPFHSAWLIFFWCLMKSPLKWTIVALRIFIERNNQPAPAVCSPPSFLLKR